MEIVSKFDSLLTNAEVIDIINENCKLPSGKAGGRPQEVLDMEKFVTSYLNGLPSKNIRREHTESLFNRLKGFSPLEGQAGFKQTELLNIANLRPATLVELYAIIDHAETRFGDDKLDAILKIVAEELPDGEADE